MSVCTKSIISLRNANIHSDGHPAARDKYGCVLPEGHDGPHEFVAEDGRHWLLETDLGCNCAHCERCEGDYCTGYWLKPAAVGALLIGGAA
ncbi:hypothetical protein Acav_3433 [Paracidovorax avenae ATCC 19860]|uniref:Uncharacterized protein n=1 Tax=Paracidovorax avenae (strain ATCC 19860 / DSM 7227 / CCUG 15838 / JCM 20985 / LMG 2117 / NCPPB 1011) TaxID=643561 RepID=F0QAU6_PARA1|nr:hypothetical protein [Paracidovorax avenae]ADX47334.1 hypothetical protein Acav_3433 [Paracidovorax avenae ATCC 19860]